jgi:hypothetical protein
MGNISVTVQGPKGNTFGLILIDGRIWKTDGDPDALSGTQKGK